MNLRGRWSGVESDKLPVRSTYSLGWSISCKFDVEVVFEAPQHVGEAVDVAFDNATSDRFVTSVHRIGCVFTCVNSFQQSSETAVQS